MALPGGCQNGVGRGDDLPPAGCCRSRIESATARTGGGQTMAERIPESHLDLFARPVLGHLATLMPDGTPQVSPVWVAYDGEHVLVNTIQGRQKDRNLLARPQVALDLVDPDDQFRYLAIRGRVVEHTTEGTAEQIDELARRYMGLPG